MSAENLFSPEYEIKATQSSDKNSESSHQTNMDEHKIFSREYTAIQETVSKESEISDMIDTSDLDKNIGDMDKYGIGKPYRLNIKAEIVND